jgi:ABC-2 type transport system permease protein
MSKTSQTADRHQVITLLRTNLKLDLRGAHNPFAGYRAQQSKIPAVAVVLGINVLYSIFLGMVLDYADNIFVGLVLSTAMGMMMIAFQVVLEFGNTMITADDYDVIAPHPVSSRTFYIAKLLHALTYVSVLSVSMSLVPAVISVIVYGQLWLGPVVLLLAWISNVFMAVVVMNIYTLILKKIDRNRLERALGYAHMLLMFGFIIGMNALPRYAQQIIAGYDFNSHLWFKCLPSYWFAAPIKLFTQGWDLAAFLCFLIGIAAIVLLGRLALSYLSLTYAESLTRTRWTRSSGSGADKPGVFARLMTRGAGHEDRALMLLIRKNFRYDTQFRLGVISFVPLLVFYLFYGLVIAKGAPKDPLAPLPDTDGMTNVLFALAAIISPFMVLASLHSSKEWRAAWVFAATPMDRVKMVLAMTRFTERLLLLPLALVLIPLLGYMYGNLLHATMHTVFLILLAQAGIAFLSMFTVRMPFAQEYKPGNAQSAALGPMIIAMLVFGVPAVVAGTAGYFGYIGWSIFVTCAVILLWALKRGQVRRIRKAVLSWEFTG